MRSRIGLHPLDEEPYASSQLAQKNPVLLELNTQLFKTLRLLTSRSQDTSAVRIPLVIQCGSTITELSDYLLSKKNFALTRAGIRSISVSRKQEK